MAFEFFKSNPFTERVRSPLYGAFIISWLVCNWEIIVSLLFFSSEDRGGLNAVDFIYENYLCIHTGLIYPILLTVCYIFLGTFLDRLVYKYIEGVKQKKIADKIGIVKNYSVSGETYYDALKEIEKERKNIVKLNIEVTGIRNKFTSEVSDLQSKINELNALIDTYKKDQEDADLYLKKLEIRHQPTIVKGKWNVTIKDENKIWLYTYEFGDNNLRVENRNDLTMEEWFINHFDYNFKTNYIYIILINSKAQRPQNYKYLSLNMQSPYLLKGNVGPDGFQIQFEKMNPEVK